MSAGRGAPDRALAAPRARLRRLRRLARAELWFEELWPAVWPALGLAGAYVCLGLFGIPPLLAPIGHAALLAATGLGILVLLGLGLRGVRRPGEAAVDRRLERDSGLRHQPLAVLADRPALAGAEGEALWRAHVAQAAAAARRLRIGLPHPGLAARDRMALRGGLVVALVAGFVVAGPDAPDRLLRALVPALPPGAPAPAPLLQAWITPPAYTDLPPVFLKPAGGAVTVPAGSRLTVSLTGGQGEPDMLLGGAARRFRALDQESWQGQADLTSGGRLLVRRGGRVIGAWDVATIADQPPVVAFAGPPGPSARSGSTRLPWKATDDYGVVSLRAELRLRDRPAAPPVVVPIPLSSSHPKAEHGVAVRDLTANPWAGLPVTARLIGRDGAGQEGRSAEAAFILPERIFHNPVARALTELRKGLSVHPEQRAPAIAGLDALAAAPDAFGGDPGVFLNLRTLEALLLLDGAPEAVDQAQARMWALAIHLEDGATARTARALAAARKAVREELDKETRTGKGDQAALDRKLKALEEAIARHMQALAQRAQQQDAPFDPTARRIDQAQLDRMIQKMREAARQGRMDEAQQEMAQLERLLDQLQNARVARRESPAQARQRRQAQQQMGALQDMLRREQGLLDRSQARTGKAQADGPADQPWTLPGRLPPWLRQLEQQAQRGQQRQGAQGGQGAQANDPQAQAQRQADARTQQALRRALGELMQQFGDMTGQVPQGLGQADSAMRDAARALGQGQDPGAAGAERRAIAALQQGGQQMAQQMARQFGNAPGQGQESQIGQGEPGMQEGEQGQYGQGGQRLDPLGRPLGEGAAGQLDGGDVRLPDKMEQARTRAIERELRRRGAERTRPQQELDYIDRLLKPF